MSERSNADDVTTPLPSGDEPAERPADDAEGQAAARRTTRRRRLIIGGVITAAVLLVLVGCVGTAALIRGGVQLADEADDDERRRDRLGEACLELETRLNRLTPPGAVGGDPRRRADAVRDENSAVRPLLVELEDMTARRDDRRRAEWASAWRQLVEARTSYAEALERQGAAGEPAFYVAPRAPGGDDVLAILDRRGPDSCAGAIRRLGHPDL